MSRLRKSLSFAACFVVGSGWAEAQENSRPALYDAEGNPVSERRDGRASVSLAVPPSLGLEAWGGWSYPFRWLKSDALSFIDPSADKFNYAYVRPNVRVLSSVKVNQAELRMDVYPFSFLGTTFGSVFTNTNLASVPQFREWSGYDCSTINCEDWNTIHFIEFKFKWALPSRFFGVFFFRRDWAKSSNQRFDLTFDPSSALPFVSAGDSTSHFWLIVGRSISERASVAGRYRDEGWKNSRARRRDWAGIFQYKLGGPWSLGFEGRQIFRTENFDFLSANVFLSYVWRNTPEPENQL